MEASMDKFVASTGRPLEWRQPNLFKMEYELKSGEALLATLRFRSSWGTFATAESAQGCWTFKRVGFWQTIVTIHPCNSEEETASFKKNTWTDGGTLLLPGTRKYLAKTTFWQTQYEFRTENGEALIHYQNSGFVRPSAKVTIHASAQAMPELAWMVPLGWYLIVMMHYDSAAAAAVVLAPVILSVQRP
jgi:hypothetical protein